MSTSESPVPVEAFSGRPARLSAVCSQPMQPRQRRLVLDISNTRLIRTNDPACSPPFRFGHIHSVPRSVGPGNSCLRAPTRYMPLAAVQGAGLSQHGSVFSPERAHKRAPLVCDVMTTEPFGKPAVWMYQIW